MNKLTPLSATLALALLPLLEPQEAATQTPQEAERAVEAVLEDMHAAAARADAARFFQLFADDAVYFGTDASERWPLRDFEALVEPAFAAGQGWRSSAVEVHVYVSDDARFAWFDERLESERWGAMRGTGVLRREGEAWKIVQYNTAFTIPNELVPDLAERIRELTEKR